jgi:hypothetical protein
MDLENGTILGMNGKNNHFLSVTYRSVNLPNRGYSKNLCGIILGFRTYENPLVRFKSAGKTQQANYEKL